MPLHNTYPAIAKSEKASLCSPGGSNLDSQLQRKWLETGLDILGSRHFVGILVVIR